MQKYFKFWPLIDLDELNEAKNEGLGAVSGTQTMKQAKSLVARIESVIRDIDGTESARYKALRYLNSNSLTPRSERFDQHKHLRQALVDADLFDLFVAGVQGRLVLMDDSTDANSAQSSMAAIRTRHLVVELIGLQRAWTECQQTGLHELIKQQARELCATIAVTTIDPQVSHLLDAPATRLVKKLMPPEFLTKLTSKHKSLDKGQTSFLRLIIHMLEDEKQHPAVMALNDKRDIEEKLSLPMEPMETASAFKIRHEEGLQEYSDFVESKRFPDGEKGDAAHCEHIILKLAPRTLRSAVMEKFDATQIKAKRKQTPPPGVDKLWKIILKQFELADIKAAREASLLAVSTGGKARAKRQWEKEEINTISSGIQGCQ